MKRAIQNIIWRFYHLWLEQKMKRIRKKSKIRFLFILQELSQWKTEMLYKAMLDHPRFDPILGIAPCVGYGGTEQKVIEYCKEKNYSFLILDPNKTISRQVKVDIVTHQKPYANEINPAHRIRRNLGIPIVSIPYYMSTITEDWVVNHPVCVLAWRQFIDNEECKREWSTIQRLKGCNYTVTGVPIMDELTTPKSFWPDTWPVSDGRKRIIYAPHHTIAKMHWKGIGYSTFLEMGEFMLQMRDKYKDQVYFVFKPHPLLYKNLVTIWGEDRAKEYYESWNLPGCSHVEVNNKYLALFKHSDAMIHDCGSFTIEYLYTGNPVMYLIKDDHHKDNMTPVGARAFDLHYKGQNEDQIEAFVCDVIQGNDPMEQERRVFIENKLLPPNHKSACQNIMNAILGEEEYRAS